VGGPRCGGVCARQRGWRDRAPPGRDERTCRGTTTDAIGRGWPAAKTRLDWPIALVSPTLLAQWAEVGDKVVREVSSVLEVKVAVDLKPYGTISREFKAKRIHDLRGA
jgi:hypothetical protein